jgi:hypothetical protein
VPFSSFHFLICPELPDPVISDGPQVGDLGPRFSPKSNAAVAYNAGGAYPVVRMTVGNRIDAIVSTYIRTVLYP